jgi:hypothetical protein
MVYDVCMTEEDDGVPSMVEPITPGYFLAGPPEGQAAGPATLRPLTTDEVGNKLEYAVISKYGVD